MKNLRVLKNSFCVVLISSFFSGCFYFTDPLLKARKALRKPDCEKVWNLFQDVSSLTNIKLRLLRFAEDAASICHINSTQTAVLFYKYLIKQNISVQKKIVFHKKLLSILEPSGSYIEIIPSYFFLKDHIKGESSLYALKLAHAYFKLKKGGLSLQIINKYLPLVQKKTFQLHFLFLKARVLLRAQQYVLSEKIFRRIQKLSPIFFKQRKMFLYISFIYEQKKAFHLAIKELSRQPPSDFLDAEIKRLKARLSQQPGK